ncbi:DUF3157 family protein [Vibrio aestuarianus]|uniref:DUF3157 family protein n=1 Tax=Vibrio aestuarianus TaxID=28171 RepID=UPI00406758F6
MTIKHVIAALLSVATNGAFAAQSVTLDDGRQVQLNDDFTWQYIAKENTLPTAAAIATPITQKTQGTVFNIASEKSIMQLSDSGIDVVLGAASYQNGELIIPTALTNQSSQSVIEVTLAVTIFNEQGQELATGKATVWQSIKRMAESYLRPQTQTQGRPIKLKVSKQDSYHIDAKVEKIETR